MTNKEHRLGVSEANLVVRHLKLEPAEQTRLQEAIAEIDQLYGLDAISFDEKTCVLNLAYDASRLILQGKVVAQTHELQAADMGIDTRQEPVVYMRSDCHICCSEGFIANSRVMLCYAQNSVIATLNVVDEHVLAASTESPRADMLSNDGVSGKPGAIHCCDGHNSGDLFMSQRTFHSGILE